MLIRKANLNDCEIFIKLRIKMRKERDFYFHESKNNFIALNCRFFKNKSLCYNIFVISRNISGIVTHDSK